MWAGCVPREAALSEFRVIQTFFFPIYEYTELHGIGLAAMGVMHVEEKIEFKLHLFLEEYNYTQLKLLA